MFLLMFIIFEIIPIFIYIFGELFYLYEKLSIYL